MTAHVGFTRPELIRGLGTFDDLSDADWQAAIDAGAMGMIRCVRAALPLLRAAGWGRIVDVSAHSTRRQTAGLVACTAAKAVVTSVTGNLSLHLAKGERGGDGGAVSCRLRARCTVVPSARRPSAAPLAAAFGARW